MSGGPEYFWLIISLHYGGRETRTSFSTRTPNHTTTPQNGTDVRRLARSSSLHLDTDRFLPFLPEDDTSTHCPWYYSNIIKQTYGRSNCYPLTPMMYQRKKLNR